MKIYKKILNFGYGICCLLPFVLMVFAFLYVMKTGENATFDFHDVMNFQNLGSNFEFVLKGYLINFSDSVEWFKPFETFNNWIATTFLEENTLVDAINGDDLIAIGFVLLYSEWVVLVSFFRLFGSVFGCMINFADRMLDKIGGTN